MIKQVSNDIFKNTVRPKLEPVKTKLLTVSPSPSVHQRFVEVNAKTLGLLLGGPTQGNDFESNAKLFYKEFQFEKLGFK
ncbi:hypothetical protein DFQ30_011498, partial [Apophysomyces sp. BC1015]